VAVSSRDRRRRSARAASLNGIASSVSQDSAEATRVTGSAAVNSAWKNPGLHWSPNDA
jgi:hypothetical protein